MTSSDSGYILALDLGTTGNRAFLFDRIGQPIAHAYRELTQHYPHPGWLEHDPIEIWQAAIAVIETAVQTAQIAPAEIKAIGLTVQRETCLLWDKVTGSRCIGQSFGKIGAPQSFVISSSSRVTPQRFSIAQA